MKTIEELKSLRDSLHGCMRECFDVEPQSGLSIKDRDEQARRVEASRAEALARVAMMLNAVSAEDWKLIDSADELAELKLYKRQYAECVEDRVGSLRFADYKVIEPRWMDFVESLTEEDATVIWNHIAQNWLGWDCLDDVLRGYYLRSEYAGFSQLFLRIREDVFAYGQAKGLSFLDILCGVGRIIEHDILVEDTSSLTDLCVGVVNGLKPEAWLIQKLIDEIPRLKECHLKRMTDECVELRPVPWEDEILPVAFYHWPELFEPLTEEEKSIRDKRRDETLRLYGAPMSGGDGDENDLAGLVFGSETGEESQDLLG